MASHRQTGNNLGIRQVRFPQLQNIERVFLISMQCINKCRLGFVFLSSAMSNDWAIVQQRLSSLALGQGPLRLCDSVTMREALPGASSRMSPKTPLPPGPWGWQRFSKGRSFRWIFNSAYLWGSVCWKTAFPSWNKRERTLRVTVPIQWPKFQACVISIKVTGTQGSYRTFPRSQTSWKARMRIQTQVCGTTKQVLFQACLLSFVFSSVRSEVLSFNYTHL